jgi:hypothetical protein
MLQCTPTYHKNILKNQLYPPTQNKVTVTEGKSKISHQDIFTVDTVFCIFRWTSSQLKSEQQHLTITSLKIMINNFLLK